MTRTDPTWEGTDGRPYRTECDVRDYYAREQRRHLESEPRPCPRCHRRDYVTPSRRTVKLQSAGGGEVVLPWWRCDACEVYGYPVSATPQETRRFYEKHGATRVNHLSPEPTLWDDGGEVPR